MPQSNPSPTLLRQPTVTSHRPPSTPTHQARTPSHSRSRRLLWLLPLALFAWVLWSGPVTPVILAQASTPSATVTASPPVTSTLSATAVPSATLAPSATSTPVPASQQATEEAIQTQEAIRTQEALQTQEAIRAAIETKIPTPTPTGTATPTPTVTPTPSADDLLDAYIDRLIESMSPEERVGQLFVVTFQGDRISPEVRELIDRYHIGGVVLSPANGNFSNSPGTDTIRQVATLTNRLQALAYGIPLSEERALDPPPSQLDTLGIPLLIGVDQAGDGLPRTALRQGFTPLPPQMALGAGWNPELTYSVGEILGRELSAVGINMLLGPTLDVLDPVRPDIARGFGIYAFGSDPFWVGKLGQAYIEGIHAGSDNQVATIANHFPGQGRSDRRPGEEVATIQADLEELLSRDLQPFARVAQRPSAILRLDGDPGATEGLMSSHSRYSGIQGSPERGVRPISLSAELASLFSLEPFVNWRQGGGVIMSDALGVPAIQRNYDPTGEGFPVRRIIEAAFVAGNDLLYLANFAPGGDWQDELNNIREAVEFLQGRYVTNSSSAEAVDAALKRILRLKLRLYGKTVERGDLDAEESRGVPLGQVLVQESDLPQSPEPTVEATPESIPGPAEGSEPSLASPAELATDADRPSFVTSSDSLSTIGRVARAAVTLLYPELETRPLQPEQDDRILIFTDSHPMRECADCPEEPAIPDRALEEIIVRLYGPEGTDQIVPSQVNSRTFAELQQFLDGALSATKQQAMADEMENADWIVFAMLDVDPEVRKESDALKRFLREQGDRPSGQNLVVLAFNAPYFLDATEISKLSAYYGIYSKIQPFLEEAVRALFNGFPPDGAPPMSVPGTRFADLSERLLPDPERNIPLEIPNAVMENEELEVVETNGESRLVLPAGTTLTVQAGPILDRNGHPVPDNTPVTFDFIYEGAELALPTEPVTTRDGLATIAVLLDQDGILSITARAGDAVSKEPLMVEIQGAEEPATPTPEPTETPTPEPTETSEAGLSSTATPTPGVAAVTPPPFRLDLSTLVVAGVTMLSVLSLLLVVLIRIMPRPQLVHRFLWAVIAGWGGYLLYGLGLIPGISRLAATFHPWVIAPVVLVSMLIPLVWLQLRSE